jgi:hypothetical protein
MLRSLGISLVLFACSTLALATTAPIAAPLTVPAAAPTGSAVTTAAPPANPIMTQAAALGAPMIAVKKAYSLAQSSTFQRHDVFAVFDIDQPAKNKRFFLFDLRAGKVSAYFVAHGRDNGDNFKATHFRGFQNDHNMTPLGPLRTASSMTDMDHYSSITDKYNGRVYSGLMTLWLEGVTSYNNYINNAYDGSSRVIWILHPAWYVTEGFRKAMPGGLGRSLGCIALDPVVSNQVMGKLQGGALVYVTVGNDAIEKYL